MSRNLETVKQIYAAFARGDIPAILDTLADNVAWEAWADNSAGNVGVPRLVPRDWKELAQPSFSDSSGPCWW